MNSALSADLKKKKKKRRKHTNVNSKTWIQTLPKRPFNKNYFYQLIQFIFTTIYNITSVNNSNS